MDNHSVFDLDEHSFPRGERPRHRVAFEELSDESIICKCNNITVRELKTALSAGAQTADEAVSRLGAEFRCGKCIGYMDSVLNFFKK